MAFLEDPRLRQRWNQITHDAETATENAAAGIWSFQQHYVGPYLGSLVQSIEQCTSVCLGDVEERRRRQRERSRSSQAEHMFDFYDDWYDEEEQTGGLLGGWGGDDWDRLLAGRGSSKQRRGGASTGGGDDAGITTDVQPPRRKRGMSYGTRGGARRKPNLGQDPTIIPSTQPIGLLSKLPWRMGGTLRYKPSAADMQEHPGKHGDAESAPLLGGGDDVDVSSDDESYGRIIRSSPPRKRSGTTGSGDTSDSYRSRGDLFPSDGEGDEDAVPLDDDVTYDMIRRDDRSSGRTTRSGKGKRPVGSRTVSRTTINSTGSRESLWALRASTGSLVPSPSTPPPAEEELYDQGVEEEQLRREEDEKLARRREAAVQLAEARGLSSTSGQTGESEPKLDDGDDEDDDEEYCDESTLLHHEEAEPVQPGNAATTTVSVVQPPSGGDEFVPARLPFFQ